MYKYFCVLMTVCILFPQWAGALDRPSRSIPDDSALRSVLKEAWLTAAPERVLNQSVVHRSLPGGDRIQVRSEVSGNELHVLLARELAGSYPFWGQGSWILSRRRDTGEMLRIRVFLRSDPSTYIQFRPSTEDRCVMDVVLYEAFVVRSLPLPYSMERLLVLPVEEALAVAGSKFPRRYFDVEPTSYRDMRHLVTRVQEELPTLTYRDDGAIDEQGNYVFIETLEPQRDEVGLNCSGFAKWMVDGLLRPYTGERLTIAPLKTAFGQRGTSFTENYEQLYDLFFGLDWGRNLASRAGGILRGPHFSIFEEFEVRETPFASLIVRNRAGITSRVYEDYRPNVGFMAEGIHPLLYTLAINEPGNLYIAVISREMPDLHQLRQYFHLAILLPYFTETGTFQVTVFESAAETSFTNFKNRYPGQFINLLRVPVRTRFEP
ncbi:MAG: hypothetical protein LBS86_08185 [Treponema sp.]|jgi:hypothetical protein|nr:hypothetical protein [Treponema sp.]